jgi:hypothetical protein
MSHARVLRPLATLLVPWLLLAGLARPVRADGDCAGCGSCGGCAAGFGAALHCPKTTFCRPKPPCIRWKCVCPKPVCDPCSLDHFGYYPTCWHNWPFPPDYSCCSQPTTGALADQLLNQPVVVANPAPTSDLLPLPRKTNGQTKGYNQMPKKENEVPQLDQ